MDKSTETAKMTPAQNVEARQKLMKEHGVQIESWGPFAEGKNDLFTNPDLTEIGHAHGKSVAQVILRWHIQRNIVVIPKSVKRDRMIENFTVFDFELSDDDMSAIKALDTKTTAFFDHRDPAWVESLSTRRLDI